jgi:hypothetical protein
MARKALHATEVSQQISDSKKVVQSAWWNENQWLIQWTKFLKQFFVPLILKRIINNSSRFFCSNNVSPSVVCKMYYSLSEHFITPELKPIPTWPLTGSVVILCWSKRQSTHWDIYPQTDLLVGTVVHRCCILRIIFLLYPQLSVRKTDIDID